MGRTRYLLSVKPRFAELLLSGRKTVELRRPKLSIQEGDELYLYASQPSSAIVGIVTCKEVVTASPNTLWLKYGDLVGVSREEFEVYFMGSSSGTALLVNHPQRLSNPWLLAGLREAVPGFHPPQSHMRVKGSFSVSLGRRKRVAQV